MGELAAVVAASRRGQCEAHPDVADEADVLRYERHSDGALVCAEAIRREAKRTRYVQHCDREGCDAEHAWRNPYTRRNEYLCGKHHAESGEGVVLNKWAPRASEPLGLGKKPDCEAGGVVGTRDCKGEVRWRRNKTDGVYHHLCNAHAGRTSSADGLADRDW